MREGFAAFSKEGIEIAAAPTATDLGTITLEHGVAIEGRVTDSKGHPIEGGAGHRNSIRPTGCDGLFRRYLPEQPEETGADGSFRIGTLKQGERYDLSVRHTDTCPPRPPEWRPPPTT